MHSNNLLLNCSAQRLHWFLLVLFAAVLALRAVRPCLVTRESPLPLDDQATLFGVSQRLNTVVDESVSQYCYMGDYTRQLNPEQAAQSPQRLEVQLVNTQMKCRAYVISSLTPSEA